MIHLFEGDRALEAVIKSLFPPDCSELWQKCRLDAIVGTLRLMAKELALPPRPVLMDISWERLPCCGGQFHKCPACGKTFKRVHKLLEKKREVHEKCNRVECPCGEEVVRRIFDRHV